jgi:hypothetical protein
MQSEMQTLNCKVGNWRAQARVQEVEAGKLMAVISVTDESGRIAADSKHTVVFDHTAGMDTLEETEELVQKLLYARYGII